MKSNLKNTLMLTAVAMTLGAAAAHAQEVVKADIPFSFHIAAGEQPAGPYAIEKLGSSQPVLTIRNMDTLHAKVIGFGSAETGSADQRPRLVFSCNDETGCVLSAVWLDGGHGVSYKTPHLKPSQLERVAVVYLDRNVSE